MPLPKYIKTDFTKATYHELWRIVRKNPLTFIVGAILKIVGHLPPPKFGISTQPDESRAAHEDMPQKIKEVLDENIQECEQLGFKLILWQAARNLGTIQGFSAILLRQDRAVWAITMWSGGRIGIISRTGTGTTFVSKLRDGNLVYTTNLPQTFDPPPWGQPAWLPAQSITKTHERHNERLRPLVETARISSTTEQNLPAILDEYGNRATEHLLGRGIYVPLSAGEIEQLSCG